MEETDGAREEDDTDDKKDAWRVAPAAEVALTAALTGRELGGAGAGLDVSPARSVKVLRLRLLGGGSMLLKRALVADAEIS